MVDEAHYEQATAALSHATSQRLTRYQLRGLSANSDQQVVQRRSEAHHAYGVEASRADIGGRYDDRAARYAGGRCNGVTGVGQQSAVVSEVHVGIAVLGGQCDGDVHRVGRVERVRVVAVVPPLQLPAGFVGDQTRVLLAGDDMCEAARVECDIEGLSEQRVLGWSTTASIDGNVVLAHPAVGVVGRVDVYHVAPETRTLEVAHVAPRLRVCATARYEDVAGRSVRRSV